MNSSTRSFLVLTIGLMLGISLTIGHGVLAKKEDTDISSLPLNELRSLTEVFGRIKQDYVEQVSDK